MRGGRSAYHAFRVEIPLGAPSMGRRSSCSDVKAWVATPQALEVGEAWHATCNRELGRGCSEGDSHEHADDGDGNEAFDECEGRMGRTWHDEHEGYVGCWAVGVTDGEWECSTWNTGR